MCFFQKMTHYFKMSYFLHFLLILHDLKRYGYIKLNFILLFEASEKKGQTKNNIKKHECTTF